MRAAIEKGINTIWFQNAVWYDIMPINHTGSQAAKYLASGIGKRKYFRERMYGILQHIP